MIIYTKDNKLITTSLGNGHKKSELLNLSFEATYFSRKENRFFKIISKEVVTRSIKHSTHEKMANEAIRKFREYVNVYNSIEHYDKERNVGYKVYTCMKNPTVFSYSRIYPAITEFFQYLDTYNNRSISKRNIGSHYDLSKLFVSMKNFKDLELLFAKEDGELLRKMLYQDFPEFAIFYYEIYPYLNLEIIGCYDITKLIVARAQVYELGLDTSQLDALVENISIAENNSKVLKLIKNVK